MSTSPELTGVLLDPDRYQPCWVALWRVGRNLVVHVPVPVCDAPVENSDQARLLAEQWALAHPPIR